jgi:hypothetical protein
MADASPERPSFAGRRSEHGVRSVASALGEGI